MPSNARAVRELWQLFDEGRYRDAMPLLADTFTADWVLSRERLTSPEAFIRVQEEYPGHGRIAVRELVDDGEHVVTIAEVTWSDGVTYTATSLWTFDADACIAGVSEWWSEPDPSPHSNRAHLVERY